MTMKKILLSIAICFMTALSTLTAQHLPAYMIYSNTGESSDFNELVQAAKSNSLILFGELHNNPISHWLQLELTKALEADSLELKIGMEMFEADNQILIDEYFSGLISQRSFEQEVRLWGNYKTDIKPVVEFAKEKDIKLIATNIPRRYASMVYNSGLESLEQLSEEARMWIAPLPVEVDLSLPGYKNMMEMAHGHGGENLPLSQAIKDATMAHFIEQNLPGGVRFLHLHGTYHSDNYEGIVWYIKKLRPLLSLLTISTIEAENIHSNEIDFSKADYTIVVPASMTKTH